jgi:hypothetical protein
MADSDVEIQFGGDAEGAMASMAQIRNALRGLSAPIQGIRDNLGELAEAVVAAFAIEKVASFVDAMGELGLQTQRTGAMLGLTSEQVGEFQGVAALTGTGVDTLTNGIERMSLNIQKSTRDSFNPAAQGLRILGLSAKELIGIPTDQWYGKLADAVSRFNPSLNLTNALMAVGGRGVAQMLPLLQQGSAGFNAFAEDVKKTGDVLTEAQAGAFTHMHESVTLLGMSFKGVGITLMSAFAPAVVAIVEALTDLVQWFNRSIQEGGTFKGLLDLLALSAKAVAGAFLTIVYTIEAVVQTVDFALRELRDAVVGNLGDAKRDMETWQKSVEDSAKGWLARMRELINGGTSGGNAAGGGPKQDAGAIDMGAKDQTGAAEKAIDGQVKLWEEWLKKQSIIYDTDAKTFAISQNQKFALVEAATEKAYQAELGLLQQEAQIGGLSVAQQQEIQNKISALKAKHDVDMTKLNAESVESMQKQWEGYFKTIEGAFNGQLRGLLAGTETWKQAMTKIFGDLVIKFIEFEEQMLAKSVSTEIAKTEAAQTGAAARAAAEQTGSGASILTIIANAMKAISAGAGQTSAEVTAAVAPAVGPAAPAVGAAAGATTMATALSYIHAETGAWEVGGGAAMLHPGEMVIPKPFAESLRDNGGGFGGGDTNHITIQAIDGMSIKNMLQGNSAIISSIVQKAAKANPSSMRGM